MKNIFNLLTIIHTPDQTLNIDIRSHGIKSKKFLITCNLCFALKMFEVIFNSATEFFDVYYTAFLLF